MLKIGIYFLINYFVKAQTKYYKTDRNCLLNKDEKCGISGHYKNENSKANFIENFKGNFRILHGTETTVENWPWMAYIQIVYNNGKHFFCIFLKIF